MAHYTDIHSHILPGVDDGAADREMTIEMIDAAYAQGVRVMIATPHYYPGHVKHPREYVDQVFQETVSAVKEKYADLRGAVRGCVEAGYYPVLAHIERYQCLWKNEKAVEELVRMGAYMQVNAENFTEGFFSARRRWCLKLAGEGLMHFLASDAHNTKERCPNIKQAADYLEEKLDEKTFHRIMYDNPARLLKGEYLR